MKFLRYNNGMTYLNTDYIETVHMEEVEDKDGNKQENMFIKTTKSCKSIEVKEGSNDYLFNLHLLNKGI